MGLRILRTINLQRLTHLLYSIYLVFRKYALYYNIMYSVQMIQSYWLFEVGTYTTSYDSKHSILYLLIISKNLNVFIL